MKVFVRTIGHYKNHLKEVEIETTVTPADKYIRFDV